MASDDLIERLQQELDEAYDRIGEVCSIISYRTYC